MEKSSHITEVATSWRRERADIDLANFLLSIYVMRLGRVVDDAYDRTCRKKYGISGADMRVIFALRRAGKPYARRPTDLYRALLVTSGAITKQVDRLSALELVERVEDEQSSSAGILIQLTTKGVKVANSATELLASESPIAPGVRSLSRSDRSSVSAFVEKILIELEAAATEKPAGKTRRSRTKGKRSRDTAPA